METGLDQVEIRLGCITTGLVYNLTGLFHENEPPEDEIQGLSGGVTCELRNIRRGYKRVQQIKRLPPRVQHHGIKATGLLRTSLTAPKLDSMTSLRMDRLTSLSVLT